MLSSVWDGHWDRMWIYVRYLGSDACLMYIALTWCQVWTECPDCQMICCTCCTTWWVSLYIYIYFPCTFFPSFLLVWLRVKAQILLKLCPYPEKRITDGKRADDIICSSASEVTGVPSLLLRKEKSLTKSRKITGCFTGHLTVYLNRH